MVISIKLISFHLRLLDGVNIYSMSCVRMCVCNTNMYPFSVIYYFWVFPSHEMRPRLETTQKKKLFYFFKIDKVLFFWINFMSVDMFSNIKIISSQTI